MAVIGVGQSIHYPSKGSGGGGVVSVSGTAPITSTGGNNPVIGIPKSTSTQSGYLSSADWVTFNGKGSSFTSGNLTDAGTDGLVVTGGTGAVIGSGTSLAIAKATTSQNGYLSSADWTTFNNASTGAPFLRLAGGTMAGDININDNNLNNVSQINFDGGSFTGALTLNAIPIKTAGSLGLTNGTHFITLSYQSGGSGNTQFNLPSSTGSSGYVLTTDGAGFLSWSAPASGSTAVSTSAKCTTESTGVTSTTFATASNSPTLTFTPSKSGTCKISMSTQVRPSSADGGELRITKTSGTGTLVAENTSGVYNLGSGLFAAVYPLSYYTVTSGSSVTFDVQLRSNGGGNFFLDCSEQSGGGSYIFAECF